MTSSAFLWDTEINPTIVTRTFFPYDTVSVTVGRLYPQIRFDEWGGTGYLLRSNGTVVHATAVTQALGLTGKQTACADSQHQTRRLVIPLDHGLQGKQERFGLVSYQSATGGIATQPDGTTVVFAKGSGTLITTLPPASLNSVVLTLRPGSSACVTGLRVVLPEPDGSAQSR
jgi:hypothetical protein